MLGNMNKNKMGETNHKLVVTCLTLLVLTVTAMSKPSRFVTKLIHRDSMESPYYTLNATTAQLAARARASSNSRLAYLSWRTTSASPDNHRAGIVAQEIGNSFMTLLNIGDPPVPQFFNIDTGSNLMWLQCLPCINCFKQLLPVFEPSKSKSYATLPCPSPLCSESCDRTQTCRFSIKYVDKASANGVMATEKLTFNFQPLDTVTDVVFGCVDENHADNGQASGMLGLGGGAVSLVTHVGSKFSYCIGNLREPSAYNFLIQGDGAKFEGDTTKLEVVRGLYYLTVTGLSIDTKAIDIDPKTFERSGKGKGGVIIDSGSTLTYLATGAYGPLRKEVMGMLDGVVERVERQKQLCYKGVIERDLIGFPVVNIHFEGGAELGMDTQSLFTRSRDGEFCMAVEESFMGDLSLIGVMAQQRYNIAYDTGAGRISFQRIDCDVYGKMMMPLPHSNYSN